MSQRTIREQQLYEDYVKAGVPIEKADEYARLERVALDRIGDREAGCPACDEPGGVPGSVMHAMHQKLAEGTNHEIRRQP